MPSRTATKPANDGLWDFEPILQAVVVASVFLYQLFASASDPRGGSSLAYRIGYAIGATTTIAIIWNLARWGIRRALRD